MKHTRMPTGRLEAELDRSSSEGSEEGIEVTREVMQTSESVNPLRNNHTGHALGRADSRDELINRGPF